VPRDRLARDRGVGGDEPVDAVLHGELAIASTCSSSRSGATFTSSGFTCP
jgi:hypothetical protein